MPGVADRVIEDGNSSASFTVASDCGDVDDGKLEVWVRAANHCER